MATLYTTRPPVRTSQLHARNGSDASVHYDTHVLLHPIGETATETFKVSIGCEYKRGDVHIHAKSSPKYDRIDRGIVRIEAQRIGIAGTSDCAKYNDDRHDEFTSHLANNCALVAERMSACAAPPPPPGG